MKKWMVMLFVCVVAIISGCKDSSYTFPPLKSQHVLVTHIKEPIMKVIDLNEKKVIYEDTLSFNFQATTKIDDQHIVAAGTSESEVLLIQLQTGKVRSILSSVSSITDLTYDKQIGMLFLTDAEHDEVLFLDMMEDKIVQTVKVGDYPYAMDKDENYLYVVNGGDGSVSIINLSTYAVESTFPVMDYPTDIVVHDGYVWVGGHGSEGQLNEFVWIYEADNGELVHKVEAGLMPVVLYKDEYNNDIFVLSHGSNEMHVLDVSSFQVKAKVDTSENPYFVTGDERYVYITALDGDTMMIVDRQNYAMVEQYVLDGGPYGIILGGNSDE